MFCKSTKSIHHLPLGILTTLQNDTDDRFGSTVTVHTGIERLTLALRTQHTKIGETDRYLRSQLDRQGTDHGEVDFTALECMDGLMERRERSGTGGIHS